MKLLRSSLLPLSVWTLCAAGNAAAAIIAFDSPDFASNAATRASWIAAIGESPDNLIDFDSLIDGAAIGVLGGVTFTNFTAECTAGGIGGSNPVGVCAAMGSETATQSIAFGAPVDYVGFLGIDYTALSIAIHFFGGGSALFSTPDGTLASGNSAEFTGIFRNDQPAITGLTFSASGSGGWGLDSLEFGSIRTAAVPEPSAFGLIGVGLLAAALVRRRRFGNRRRV